MLKLKPGTKFASHHIAIPIMVTVVNSVFQKYGYDCVITSANDGVHGVGSLHPKDMADDFRSKHLPDEATKKIILAEIKEALGDQFDVLLEYLGKENEHYHIEWDPK